MAHTNRFCADQLHAGDGIILRRYSTTKAQFLDVVSDSIHPAFERTKFKSVQRYLQIKERKHSKR